MPGAIPRPRSGARAGGLPKPRHPRTPPREPVVGAPRDGDVVPRAPGQRPRARRAVGDVGDGHRPCVPDRPRAPGLPAAEPVRPHRRVGAMRRDRALTRPTSCLPRIRASASGTCPVVGTAHRFSCFRADGRRIEPIPRGRPIDTDRGREAASCNRRHSGGRPRRRAGRDGGRVRLPRAAPRSNPRRQGSARSYRTSAATSAYKVAVGPGLRLPSRAVPGRAPGPAGTAMRAAWRRARTGPSRIS